MKRRSYRRKRLSKIADQYGLLIFKISLVVLAVLFAAAVTYLLSTSRGRF